jgi:hypothetical protein
MARSRNPSVARWGLPHTHSAFRPYVVALGQLTLAWNELHEAMALLFCSVMGGGYANQFLAVWHTINSDRNQRGVLVAAAENDINRPASDMRHKELVDKIKWICGQANTLEDLRNDSLHSQLIARGQQVAPMSGLGHIRAGKLQGKADLLAEFRRCRDGAKRLTEYVRAIDDALANGTPLPDNLRLPPRGGTKVRKRPRREQRATSSRQPPPSSA